MILGAYMSALQHRPIDLPVDPDPDLIAALRTTLSQDEGP